MLNDAATIECLCMNEERPKRYGNPLPGQLRRFVAALKRVGVEQYIAASPGGQNVRSAKPLPDFAVDRYPLGTRLTQRFRRLSVLTKLGRPSCLVNHDGRLAILAIN
jgi:hypothetical protein